MTGSTRISCGQAKNCFYALLVCVAGVKFFSFHRHRIVLNAYGTCWVNPGHSFTPTSSTRRVGLRCVPARSVLDECNAQTRNKVVLVNKSVATRQSRSKALPTMLCHMRPYHGIPLLQTFTNGAFCLIPVVHCMLVNRSSSVESAF